MSILKKPLITEKMTKAGEKLGQYGFIFILCSYIHDGLHVHLIKSGQHRRAIFGMN